MKKKLIILGFGFFLSIAVSIAAYAQTTKDSCINNTKDEAQCKDCCDCLDGDATAHQTCRDTCPTHDFANNSNFITVNAPSTLGPNGDYSAALNSGSEQACKLYCDGSSALSCGDRRYCRDKCNAAEFTDPTNTNGGGEGISIEQAISDEAQQNTIAFDGLAFLTGDICSDTFLPPGKVADFSGFQYFRDTDPTELGHNTDFVTIIAFNILNILNETQIASLVTLAKTQIAMINEYGYQRFPLIKAFRRLIEDDMPDGTTGLDKTAVMKYSAELYLLDGQISYGRAQALGNIIRGFTTEQKAKIDALKALNGIGNWNKTLANPLENLKLEKDENVAVMTYASEMYSWYAGSVDADTYFCPERQGTYFGSFYMKDAPAMAAGPGFTIPSNLTADMGSSFIATLTTSQAALISNLVNVQKDDLYEIVEVRRKISTELRKFMQTDTIDEAGVLTMAERYGELDGAIIYYYATHFTDVHKTLTTEQATKLTALRESWNTIPCSGAYLYSEKLNAMPEIDDTDFLFGAGTGENTLIAEGAAITKIVGSLLFTEGPASDKNGNLYFSDITAKRIYKWSTDKVLTVFKENSGGANGLFFDKDGNLLACEGANKRLVSIDTTGNVTVLVDKYNSKTFNEPNDLWIDAKGGVYFSDPIYLGASLTQDGEHVYYLTPKRDNTMRVISDMIRPNGIIGTSDGKTLYVADHGAGTIYKYGISENGGLTEKTLFVSSGSDGMTIDNKGNIYLTTETGVKIYSSSGNLLETIAVPETPSNVCFGGKDGYTLFITARTSVYSIKMQVTGVSSSDITPPVKPENLSYAISVLQILAGESPDINSNIKLGLQDVISLIKKLAGFIQ